MPYLTSLGQNLPDDSNYSALSQLGAGIRNALASIAGAGNAMPESYGANAPIMDPLARLAIGAGQAAVSGATAPGDALAGKLDPMSDEGLKRSLDLAGLLTLGAGAMPAEADALRMGIKAYHGSPHDFDAFSLDKIGTGEGAQAYGHGLYFAENEPVAQYYQEALSPKIGGLADSFLQKHNGNRQAALDEFDQYYKDIFPEERKILETGDRPRSGRMYEVNINADPEQFLDWDKPLSEQQRQLASSLVPNRAAYYADPYSSPTGQLLIDDLSKGIYKNQPQATEVLRQAGIPGIKYLDQGSRAAGDGSRNYVVFDDRLIDILKKYGLFGAAALPALGSSNNGKT